LGSRGTFIRYLFLGTFLAFSIGWQYDVFFHQLPRNKNTFWGDGKGRKYLIGQTFAQHKGWDTYLDDVCSIYPPIASEGDFSLSPSEVLSAMPQRKIFRPTLSPLPLKNIPQKGALILFNNDMGKAFQDWIRFYYPDVHPKPVMNPFGDIEIRVWEINPQQVQDALTTNRGRPPGGMLLSWYDSNDHRLGHWMIPTLSSKILNSDWFSDDPGVEPPFPWKKVAYFIVEGKIQDTVDQPLAIDTTGQVDGTFNGNILHLNGNGDLKRLRIHSAADDWTTFKIRYTPHIQGEFAFDFLHHTPTGWDMVPSSDLRP
jgi:hypothetical protein